MANPPTDRQQGLEPDTPNWAVGLTVKFAAFDFASIHSRKNIERANQRREEQLYGQTIQSVTGRSARARARLEGAERVAGNTPIELQASTEAESQARARFQAGLATSGRGRRGSAAARQRGNRRVPGDAHHLARARTTLLGAGKPAAVPRRSSARRRRREVH